MGLDIYFHKCKRGNYERYEKAHKEWQEQQPESSKIHNDDYEKLPEEEKAKIQQELRAWWDKEPTMKDYEISDIGYFRKVNFLMAFFNYYDNCVYKEIAKSELEDLKERTDKLMACKPVRKVKHWYRPEDAVKKANPVENEDYWVEKIYSKADQELAEDLLPTQSGFFYGNTEYNHYYWEDVKEVNEWVEEVLNDLKDEEIVLMYCWW